MKKIVTNYLKKIAQNLIKRFSPKIIGVTGSVGKTSTKDAVYDVLKCKYGNSIRKSPGNLNSEFGLPLAIIGINYPPMGAFQWIMVLIQSTWFYLKYLLVGKFPLVLVLEYGSEKPGDIKYLTKIAQPSVAIITEVGPAHLQNYKNIEEIAKEKMSLATGMQPDGVVILNKDNKYIVSESKKLFCEKMWYSGSKLDGIKNIKKSVAKLFKIEENKECNRFNKNTKGRLNIIEGINKSIVLDDSYNSNPMSVRLAFMKLDEIRKTKNVSRTIIVLGDMLELGKDELKMHLEIAKLAKKKSDFFVSVGNRFKKADCDRWFLTPIQAGEYLEKEIKKGDLVLVKGSQGIRMEKVLEKIIANKKEAEKILVRQSSAWKKTKFIQP